MKIILVLLLCLVYPTFSQTKDVIEEINELKRVSHEYCANKTNTPEHLIQLQIQQNIYTNNENLKCYEACKLVYFGLVDEKTGKYSLDYFVKNYPKALTDVYGKILTDCNTKDFGENRCEEVWEYLTNCYVKQPNFEPY